MMKKILYDRNIERKIKFNYKLWNKFLKRRMYGWDLVRFDEEGESKIFRSITGNIVTEYKGENKQISIPDDNTTSSKQVNNLLCKYKDDTNRFLIARELCRRDSKYKIKYKLILKEIRDL